MNDRRRANGLDCALATGLRVVRAEIRRSFSRFRPVETLFTSSIDGRKLKLHMFALVPRSRNAQMLYPSGAGVSPK